MIANNNGDRYRNYRYWEASKNQPYDYENEGILNKYVSPVIYKTKNKILKQILFIYENSLLMMNKYIDLLQNCHNFLKWNR